MLFSVDMLYQYRTEPADARVSTPPRHYLLASDFDQTLSFNDSGFVLAELLGISGFEHKVKGLAASNLVQQGGELAYLIRHDPNFEACGASTSLKPDAASACAAAFLRW